MYIKINSFFLISLFLCVYSNALNLRTKDMITETKDVLNNAYINISNPKDKVETRSDDLTNIQKVNIANNIKDELPKGNNYHNEIKSGLEKKYMNIDGQMDFRPSETKIDKSEMRKSFLDIFSPTEKEVPQADSPVKYVVAAWDDAIII